MMHGMTGTSEMMRPFAEKILPEGWESIGPTGRVSLIQSVVIHGGGMKVEIILEEES